jgi:hypothetical protein
MINLLRLRLLKYDEQIAPLKDGVDEFYRVAGGKIEVYNDEEYD